MKWESEDQIHAGLRRLTEEMRRLRHELRSREASSGYRRTPSLPTEDERKLRPTRPDKADQNDER